MSTRARSIVVGGFALFSMFFGAGNVIFPLVLGASTGAHPVLALLGLTLTAVIIPLIGLLALTLFDGDHRAFFGRVGKGVGWFLFFLCQMVQGPFGASPRILTLMYGTLRPFLPGVSPMVFSLLAALVLFVLLLQKGRLVQLLGGLLTPLLLLSVALVIFLGLGTGVAPLSMDLSSGASFALGFRTGYNSTDLLAAPLFAPLVLSYFRQGKREDMRTLMQNFFWASIIATSLLLAVYSGLVLLAARHVSHLPAGMPPEQLLHAVCHILVGPTGALVASMIVVLACATTVLSLMAIFSDYVYKEWFRERIHPLWCLAGTLLVTAGMATLGFAGIMALLGPFLLIAYPIYIALSLLNIGYKLFAVQPVKLPLALTLALITLVLLGRLW